MKRVTRHCLFITFLFTSLYLRAGTIFPIDTIQKYTMDCGAMMNICLPMPATELSNYFIMMDGNPYSGGIIGCDFDTTVNYSYNTLFGLGNLGPYHLDAWTVNNTTYEGMFQNINELVAMLNVWDPQGDWTHNPGAFTIEGGSSGMSYSDMEVTVMMNQTPSVIGMNFGLLPMGSEMEFGEGSHTLIVLNTSNGDHDTLTVIVECLQQPPPMMFYDTIQADGLPYTVCLDTTQLFGNYMSVSNACAGDAGQYVSFYYDQNTLCVKYEGLVCGGTEQACMVVCDDFGMCDTTYFVITVSEALCMAESQKWTDTILINFSDIICVDTTGLPGTIVSVENLCPDDSGESVVFDYDENTHCVSYTGIAEGLDEACFLLTDQYGNTDTAFVCVNVGLPENGIIIDTLLIGLSETYCIETTELAGNILNIENFCPALSGDEVDFVIDDVTLCVEAITFDIGTDTACIVLCDDFGVCDTTYIYITVVPDQSDPCYNAPPPVAVDDAASTQLNTPVTIDILANDDPGNCLPFTLEVLDPSTGGIGPSNGLTVMNPDQTVDYVAQTGFCGSDSFQYVLCNQNGCDTATVVVDIACVRMDSIIIYNGFSPNDDGINEFFKIENIEKFPDSEVKVFNRWGNIVFEAKGYKNNWRGNYRGAALPDGTYFYKIDLDSRRMFDGFLQINR